MTSVSSRADAGTGRASRGMARTHSAILAGLVGPRNHPRLSHIDIRTRPPLHPTSTGYASQHGVGHYLAPPAGRPRGPIPCGRVHVAGCPRVRARVVPAGPARVRGAVHRCAMAATALDPGILRPSRRPPTAAPSQRGHRPLRGAEGGHRPAPRIGDDHAEHSLCRMGGGPMSVAVAPADPGGHASGADPFVRTGRSATRRWRTSRTCRPRRSPRSGRCHTATSPRCGSSRSNSGCPRCSARPGGCGPGVGVDQFPGRSRRRRNWPP